MKDWVLTPQAESSLIDIAAWTVQTFGARQAEIYRDNLIECCEKITKDRIVSQSCSILADLQPNEDLRFTQSGKHYVVYIEKNDLVVVVDFLHSGADLEKHLTRLQV